MTDTSSDTCRVSVIIIIIPLTLAVFFSVFLAHNNPAGSHQNALPNSFMFSPVLPSASHKVPDASRVQAGASTAGGPEKEVLSQCPAGEPAPAAAPASPTNGVAPTPV